MFLRLCWRAPLIIILSTVFVMNILCLFSPKFLTAMNLQLYWGVIKKGFAEFLYNFMVFKPTIS